MERNAEVESNECNAVFFNTIYYIAIAAPKSINHKSRLLPDSDPGGMMPLFIAAAIMPAARRADSQGPEGTLAVVPDDRLDAGVLGERILAELASDAALLEAAERDIRVQGTEKGKISDQRAPQD